MVVGRVLTPGASNVAQAHQAGGWAQAGRCGGVRGDRARHGGDQTDKRGDVRLISGELLTFPKTMPYQAATERARQALIGRRQVTAAELGLPQHVRQYLARPLAGLRSTSPCAYRV